MLIDTLAISPIDGRYEKKTSSLRTHFSEAALISYRIKIELLYLEMIIDAVKIRISVFAIIFVVNWYS